MNTTDRSVGSIDYAVRRRFAFVTLKADESVIEDKKARKLFKKIKDFITENNSGEYEIDDLIVGHSYFIAKDDELELKLKYEILPLLDEYYKDGILKTNPKTIYFLAKLDEDESN